MHASTAEKKKTNARTPTPAKFFSCSSAPAPRLASCRSQRRSTRHICSDTSAASSRRKRAVRRSAARRRPPRRRPGSASSTTTVLLARTALRSGAPHLTCAPRPAVNLGSIQYGKEELFEEDPEEARAACLAPPPHLLPLALPPPRSPTRRPLTTSHHRYHASRPRLTYTRRRPSSTMPPPQRSQRSRRRRRVAPDMAAGRSFLAEGGTIRPTRAHRAAGGTPARIRARPAALPPSRGWTGRLLRD